LSPHSFDAILNVCFIPTAAENTEYYIRTHNNIYFFCEKLEVIFYACLPLLHSFEFHLTLQMTSSTLNQKYMSAFLQTPRHLQ